MIEAIGCGRRDNVVDLQRFGAIILMEENGLCLDNRCSSSRFSDYRHDGGCHFSLLCIVLRSQQTATIYKKKTILKVEKREEKCEDNQL